MSRVVSATSRRRQWLKKGPRPADFRANYGTHPPTDDRPPAIRRTCWGCYPPRSNVIGHVIDGREQIDYRRPCPGCGHRAALPMRECDCDACKARKLRVESG